MEGYCDCKTRITLLDQSNFSADEPQQFELIFHDFRKFCLEIRKKRGDTKTESSRLALFCLQQSESLEAASGKPHTVSTTSSDGREL